MKLSAALAGLMVLGCALPAAAQTTTTTTTTSYYIVQDPATHHCTIVDQRPVAHTDTVVGPDGVIYKTRTEAEDAMKTVKVCTTE